MSRPAKISIAILVLVLVVGAVFYYSQRADNPSTENIQENRAVNTQPDPKVAEKYESTLPGILQEFSNAYRAADASAKRAIAEQAKQKLIALVVPVDQKDLHLTLVLAMSHLASGDARGEGEYAKAVSSHDWLGQVSLK